MKKLVSVAICVFCLFLFGCESANQPEASEIVRVTEERCAEYIRENACLNYDEELDWILDCLENPDDYYPDAIPNYVETIRNGLGEIREMIDIMEQGRIDPNLDLYLD